MKLFNVSWFSIMDFENMYMLRKTGSTCTCATSPIWRIRGRHVRRPHRPFQKYIVSCNFTNLPKTLNIWHCWRGNYIINSAVQIVIPRIPLEGGERKIVNIVFMPRNNEPSLIKIVNNNGTLSLVNIDTPETTGRKTVEKTSL